MNRYYSIYDKESGIFLTPFVAQNDVDAIRIFKSNMRNSDFFSPFKEQFSLNYLFEFNPDDGSVLYNKVHLMNGSDVDD